MLKSNGDDGIKTRVPATRSLWRLLPYYHPYRLQVATGLTAVIAAAALATLIPAYLQRGIDEISDGSHLNDILRLGGLMVLTTMASGSLRFVMRYLLNGVSRRIETDLRRDVYEKLTVLDAAWYSRWKTGDLMARLTNDLSAVRMAAGPAVMYFVNTLFGGIFAVAMMLRISPTLTGATLLPMLLLPVLMIWLGRLVHQQFEMVQSQFSNLTTRAQENLSGVRVVRAYRQERPEIERFGRLGDDYLDANIRLARLNGLMNPGFALLAGLGVAVTLAVGGRLLISNGITVGGFVAFGIYLTMLTWPLIALGWTTNLFQRGGASLARVQELMDAKPVNVIDDVSVSDSLSTEQPGDHSIEFRDVWFHYPLTDADRDPAGTGPRWVLRNINLSIPSGGTLAIVGATGSGKSALMDLLPRMFDPQRGTILIGGVDTRTLSLRQLRSLMGYVPQEALLFSETVGENIAYGIPHASVAQLNHAADIAQLSETIAALPQGYETRLGERGINLSGGQKQRTALARALARDPGIVLLDDALSAVDTNTEAAILAALNTALEGRTAIITSHRVSTVRNADHIIVLADGVIIEQGTHDALLAQGKRYAELWQRQQLLDAIEAA